MTPDPADRLARLTPAAGPDPADLLFRMGRASAPTRLYWKLGVLTLAATNLAALAWIAVRPDPPAPAPEVVTVVVPVAIPVPVPEPSAAPVSPPLEPWSVGALRRRPDLGPASPTLVRVVPPAPPLTPLAAGRGEID